MADSTSDPTTTPADEPIPADASTPTTDDATSPTNDAPSPPTAAQNNPEEEDLEARAIAQAMASADASYIPSPSLLSSDDPHPLLTQVDGPPLSSSLLQSPSVYQAKSVPVPLRTKFDVPIHITAGGSVVEYEISTQDYDIGFAVTAEREEGVTNVKENARVDAVTGKFLVGSVPCALVFSFDNEYSWFREKRVSYRITVTPPRAENVVRGRRLRAKKALEVVGEDRREVEERYERAVEKRVELEEQVKRLKKELAEKVKSLDVVVKEESWLEKRREVRDEQIKMLNQRLKNGWEDEKSEI
ncbi:hypothetical protein HJC23_009696 [Cyclotella cryptica]|uniref:GOLD domain-containing protein n=1 Tax=Cyclotella cryptica TaxID=29204 RepID=A0ABD3Q849_9STRA|eukprot:CCRYP_007669-RA/>CCRYP_007669-RA protein AED:0.44 eAED:0.44 QI:0/-1/0/1/-1/1/1/0/300